MRRAQLAKVRREAARDTTQARIAVQLAQRRQQAGEQRASASVDHAHGMHDQRAQCGFGSLLAEPRIALLRGHDRAEVRRQRLAQQAARLQHFAQAQARSRDVGRQAYCLGKGSLRLVEAAAFALQRSEVDQRRRIVRIGVARLQQQFQRLVRTATPVCADGEEVQRVGVPGRTAQQVRKRALGFQHASLAGQGKSGGAQRGRIGHGELLGHRSARSLRKRAC